MEMSTELRSLSFAVLVALAVPALVAGQSTLALISLAVLAIAATGLLPPVPPMVNGVAAVLGGAVLATTALASGRIGLVALALAPLAVASLRFGWRVPLWSFGFALLGAGVVVPDALRPPPVASLAVTLLIAAGVLVWTSLHLYFGRQLELEHDGVDGLAPAPIRS